MPSALVQLVQLVQDDTQTERVERLERLEQGQSWKFEPPQRPAARSEPEGLSATMSHPRAKRRLQAKPDATAGTPLAHG